MNEEMLLEEYKKILEMMDGGKIYGEPISITHLYPYPYPKPRVTPGMDIVKAVVAAYCMGWGESFNKEGV